MMEDQNIVMPSDPYVFPTLTISYAAVEVQGSFWRFAWAVLWLWPVAVFHYVDHAAFVCTDSRCKHKLFRWRR